MFWAAGNHFLASLAVFCTSDLLTSFHSILGTLSLLESLPGTLSPYSSGTIVLSTCLCQFYPGTGVSPLNQSPLAGSVLLLHSSDAMWLSFSLFPTIFLFLFLLPFTCWKTSWFTVLTCVLLPSPSPCSVLPGRWLVSCCQTLWI